MHHIIITKERKKGFVNDTFQVVIYKSLSHGFAMLKWCICNPSYLTFYNSLLTNFASTPWDFKALTQT